jgi:hypothetical protein
MNELRTIKSAEARHLCDKTRQVGRRQQRKILSARRH